MGTEIDAVVWERCICLPAGVWLSAHMGRLFCLVAMWLLASTMNTHPLHPHLCHTPKTGPVSNEQRIKFPAVSTAGRFEKDRPWHSWKGEFRRIPDTEQLREQC